MRANPCREAALRLLPDGARLRVDRADALYVVQLRDVTDWERARFEAEGFVTGLRGALPLLYPGEGLLPPLRTWAGEWPDDPLWLQVHRLSERPARNEEYLLLSAGLKRLELGARDSWIAYDKTLRQTAAMCLRTGYGGALALCRAIQRLCEEEPS